MIVLSVWFDTVIVRSAVAISMILSRVETVIVGFNIAEIVTTVKTISLVTDTAFACDAISINSDNVISASKDEAGASHATSRNILSTASAVIVSVSADVIFSHSNFNFAIDVVVDTCAFVAANNAVVNSIADVFDAARQEIVVSIILDSVMLLVCVCMALDVDNARKTLKTGEDVKLFTPISADLFNSKFKIAVDVAVLIEDVRDFSHTRLSNTADVDVCIWALIDLSHKRLSKTCDVKLSIWALTCFSYIAAVETVMSVAALCINTLIALSNSKFNKADDAEDTMAEVQPFSHVRLSFGVELADAAIGMQVFS